MREISHPTTPLILFMRLILIYFLKMLLLLGNEIYAFYLHKYLDVLNIYVFLSAMHALAYATGIATQAKLIIIIILVNNINTNIYETRIEKKALTALENATNKKRKEQNQDTERKKRKEQNRE